MQWQTLAGVVKKKIKVGPKKKKNKKIRCSVFLLFFSSANFRLSFFVLPLLLLSILNFLFCFLGVTVFFFLIFKYFFLSTFFFWCVDLGRPTKPPGALFFFSFKKKYFVFFYNFLFFFWVVEIEIITVIIYYHRHYGHYRRRALQGLSTAGRVFKVDWILVFLFRFYF